MWARVFDATGELSRFRSERAASRRTRTRLKPSERRKQLTEVAKEIILKEGMHAATMKRIAAQAGVSETQVYNYFGSQEKLFVALAIAETAKIRAAQIADVSQFKDHYAQVIASTRTYLRQIDRRSDLVAGHDRPLPGNAMSILANLLVYAVGDMLTQCDPFGIQSTSHWTGAAIIVQFSRTKNCIVTRPRTSPGPMPSSLAG